ncbi:recombination activating protein [Perkinsela sp. CCAP 1560/4]|nr:recombination activating protein [Perkinsela sp. CCAP 1560/4]|eukprot:KNH07281.1 recombination activating protein [Perkinsela sp. CCAP 1560/4]
MRPLARALPVASLPRIPYTLPKQDNFQPESTGAFQKEWLRGLPAYRKMAENARYLPSHEDFWKASASQAVSIIASRMNYHDMLHSAALDGILPIEALLRAPGAPTPDLIYEDIMRWKTFDRIQKPPEEQFVLEANVLQQLLSQCAHVVMVDPDYFASAELFFRKIEQQQNVGSTAYSCWALMCAASSRIPMALDVLAFMDTQGMAFDQHVFVLCMNPGASDFQSRIRGGEKSNKGFVRQLRLLNRLAISVEPKHAASSPAIHAFFVMYNLTLHHIGKWELLRLVVNDERFDVPLRTRHYAAAMIDTEGARRCGPLTVQALLILFARNGDFSTCVRLLTRIRQNEMFEEHLSMCPILVIRKETIQKVEKYLYAGGTQDHFDDAPLSLDFEELDAFDTALSVIDHHVDQSTVLPEPIAVSKIPAAPDREVERLWISFLIRIRENGIPMGALAWLVSGLRKHGKLDQLPGCISSNSDQEEGKSLSIRKEGRIQKTASHHASRQKFLKLLLPAKPLKPLRVPLKRKHSPKRASLRKTNRLEASRKASQSSPATAPILPRVKTEAKLPHSQPPGDDETKENTPKSTPVNGRNYVEEIPAENNPFEKDKEQDELMRRVQKRQETQTDIDTSQNKQAINQLYQREQERTERIGRLAKAWTLS